MDAQALHDRGLKLLADVSGREAVDKLHHAFILGSASRRA
jgi:hypothetical protein